MKRTRTKLSITIENLKISQIEEELELPKDWLKSENQKIILISLTYLESTYKILHFLF
jgi:hypothetical protein